MLTERLHAAGLVRDAGAVGGGDAGKAHLQAAPAGGDRPPVSIPGLPVGGPGGAIAGLRQAGRLRLSKAPPHPLTPPRPPPALSQLSSPAPPTAMRFSTPAN
ncbi:Protein of unknown function [Gryllus bimaculatus]|nr:Protein of unknown function [Gryllus bimaculatus]